MPPGHRQARRLSHDWQSGQITSSLAGTLRELLIVSDKIARKRQDLAQGSVAYDFDIDPLAVAREFIQEVLLRKMT